MKAMTVVAWVLVGILAIGVGGLAFVNQQQAQKAAALREALVQVAAAAGIQELAPAEPETTAVPAEEGAEAGEAQAPAAVPVEPVPLTAAVLQDSAALAGVVQQVQDSIQAAQMELAGTKDSLSAVQSEASGAKAEVATLTQKTQEQAAQAEAQAKDLAAKDEASAAAKAEGEKAVQEAKAAQETAEKEKAELAASLESFQAQAAEEKAALQAKLDAMEQMEAAAPAAEGAEAVAGEEPAAMPETLPEEDESLRVIGRSEMFSVLRYSPEDQTLFCNLHDGQSLTYLDVPREIYEDLVAAGDGMDMFFRFKIQSVYKSRPLDSAVIRKYWQGQRYRPVRSDVRAAELPEEAPPEEAESAGEVPEGAAAAE